jgi:hypothetical protein
MDFSAIANALSPKFNQLTKYWKLY